MTFIALPILWAEPWLTKEPTQIGFQGMGRAGENMTSETKQLCVHFWGQPNSLQKLWNIRWCAAPAPFQYNVIETQHVLKNWERDGGQILPIILCPTHPSMHSYLEQRATAMLWRFVHANTIFFSLGYLCVCRPVCWALHWHCAAVVESAVLPPAREKRRRQEWTWGWQWHD